MRKSLVKIFSGLLAVMASVGIHAQALKIDSLETALQHAQNDSSTIDIMNDLALTYYADSSAYSEELSIRALRLSNKVSYAKGSCASLSLLGFIYMYRPDYAKALDYYNRGTRVAEKSNNELYLCQISNRMGVLYQYMGDYRKASEKAFYALRIADELGDKILQTSINNNIGNIYAKLNDNQRALFYFRKSYLISKSANELNGMAVGLNNIGDQFTALEIYDSAYFYLEQALTIHTALKNKGGIAYVYSGLASMYEKQRKYHEQKEFLFRIIPLIKGEDVDFSGVYTDVGNCYLHLGQLDSAAYYLLMSQKQEEMLGQNDLLIKTYEGLYELYSAKHDYKPALEFYRRSVVLNDSVRGADATSKIENSRIIFEQEQASKLAILKEEQTEAERAALEKQNRIVLASVLGGLLLVSVFSIYVLRSLRVTRKQKILIEEKQKEIIDSIEYAKRIQNSLLPSEKQIAKHMNRLKKQGHIK